MNDFFWAKTPVLARLELAQIQGKFINIILAKKSTPNSLIIKVTTHWF